jgi:hypothetical protein
MHKAASATGKAHKAWLVIGLTLLVSTAGVLIVKRVVTGSFRTEAPRPYQATPEATVTKMFELLREQGESFSSLHFLTDKNLSPGEQGFAELFWNTRRCGVLYTVLSERQTELQALSKQDDSSSSATVKAQVRVLPTGESEKSDRLIAFEVRKRGGNWYIYELRTEKFPSGVVEKFEQLQ